MIRPGRFAAVAALLCAASPAPAQDAGNVPGRQSTVQSSFMMTVQLNPGEDTLARQQEITKSFYAAAAGSCGLLLETLAEKCEVSNVTSDARVLDREARGGPQVTLTGRIVMRVTFKRAVGAPAAR